MSSTERQAEGAKVINLCFQEEAIAASTSSYARKR